MNIYVGNLSLEMTEDELRREFAEFGEVISVIVMNDRYIGSGQTRAYAYVEMASKIEGAAAITNLEGKKLRNRIIKVIEALPLSHKNGITIRHLKNNYRLNRNRERKCQIT
jgi:RNA recognition motif-containing protein